MFGCDACLVLEQEEEARLIAEEEAKEEAARKAVEDEKARKRLKAKEKVRWLSCTSHIRTIPQVMLPSCASYQKICFVGAALCLVSCTMPCLWCLSSVTWHYVKSYLVCFLPACTSCRTPFLFYFLC